MPKRGWSFAYLVAATGLVAALAPPSLLAGPRIAPVAAACPAERPERAIDADGVNDRCVARAEAACPGGAELRTDATGVADACVVAGSAGASAGVRDIKTRKTKNGKIEADIREDAYDSSQSDVFGGYDRNSGFN